MRTGTSLRELGLEFDMTYYTDEQRDCRNCFEPFEGGLDIWFEQCIEIDGHDSDVADDYRDDLPQDYVDGFALCVEDAMETYEPCENHV